MTIKIVKAEMLIDLDANTLFAGKMDPFCKLRYNEGAVKKLTTVKEDVGKNPIWNEEYMFEIESDKDISFKVFDKDLIKETLGGEYAGSVSTILGPEPEEEEYFESTLSLKKDDKLTGTLTIRTKL